MSRHEREFDCLVKEYGGVLVRRRKHLVYKFPAGETLVVSATSGDWRNARKNVSELNKLLGLNSGVARIGKRKMRSKPVKPNEGFLHGVQPNEAKAGGVRIGRMPVLKPPSRWAALWNWLRQMTR